MSLEFEWFVNCFDKTCTLTSGKNTVKSNRNMLNLFLMIRWSWCSKAYRLLIDIKKKIVFLLSFWKFRVGIGFATVNSLSDIQLEVNNRDGERHLAPCLWHS